MRPLLHRSLLLVFFLPSALQASILGRIQGIVHDPRHRPIANAHITLAAANSDFQLSADTNSDGLFLLPAVPLGVYTVTAAQPGFATMQQTLTLASNTSPTLHFELHLASVSASVDVSAEPLGPVPDSVTPTTLIDRLDIAHTPGADRTNSLAMITDFVPGAYITHDMLHMRGGHQVTWQIDGVEIPNTNIASNLGAQIDPKDIDFLEVQRGSYTADLGDRTYGIFNVVPRSGFERNNEAELILSAGNFLQTNDQLNYGTHTRSSALYASLTGNRSDFGLSPPTREVLHDAANGVGAFVSLLGNRTAKTQLRFVSQYREDFFQIPYDPDPTSFGNQTYDSSRLRDAQHERDALAEFSLVHTFSSATVLQVSPFFHTNRASYDPPSLYSDQPVATTSDRTSNYGGLQASITGQFARNTLQAGLYGFAQHDSFLFGGVFNDGSNPAFAVPGTATGGVAEEFLSDTWKPVSWLALTGGLRASRFQGAFTESFINPRVGAALQIPRLHWVFRAFYGRFYQPPPLFTASGPVVDFASANNTAFLPLHGERDEEHQFGVQIPLPGRLSGWLLDADTFQTRANNFLDHSNIGESSLYFPVTVDGALVQGWELTLRSPRVARLGQAHLAYSNQIARQRGAITGGLVCAPVGDPACAAAFTYTPLDHDQRNTLNFGFDATLPSRIGASADVAYGSGFHNGHPDSATPYPNPYLPQHTTVDLRLSRSFAESTTLSVNVLNVANRRVLLDNSLTFGGFHFNDPRELYGELRYKFHF